jgi:hypothetical protein
MVKFLPSPIQNQFAPNNAVSLQSENIALMRAWTICSLLLIISLSYVEVLSETRMSLAAFYLSWILLRSSAPLATGRRLTVRRAYIYRLFPNYLPYTDPCPSCILHWL